ncbi:pleckstrin homology domain-containing family S member 1-like [Spea bombifrons]|uniref:pleckstrin homology domain-containing family S member 1-like n=1 Tax=Spea bombifrons TaxID=233779 RepID=UPI00234BCC23|nr:pleckstrin homology domain-containing family S member 1-like [Spea bombifrons]
MKSVSLNSGLPRGPPSLPRKGLKSYELFDRVIQNPDSSKNAGITQSAEPAKDSLTEEEEEKLSEKQNQDDLVEVEISMLKEHLKNFLTVLEVGEYLCVSKWNGPKEIGCRFYHGDHIKAVNDIRLKTNDLYTELLENSLSDQVRLTVVRNPKAEVFHTEGCRCKNS